MVDLTAAAAVAVVTLGTALLVLMEGSRPSGVGLGLLGVGLATVMAAHAQVLLAAEVAAAGLGAGALVAWRRLPARRGPTTPRVLLLILVGLGAVWLPGLALQLPGGRALWIAVLVPTLVLTTTLLSREVRDNRFAVGGGILLALTAAMWPGVAARASLEGAALALAVATAPTWLAGVEPGPD